MLPIPTVSLVRVVRRMEDGAHQPPLIEADDGHRYVLKLWGESPDFPCCELVGSLLAHALGVETPEVAFVVVPDGIRAGLAAFGNTWKDLATAPPAGVCFGSRYLGPAAQRWSPSLSALTDELDEVTVRLFVLDLLLENGDRQAGSNPNVLLVGRRLVAFDHGQALPSVQGVSGGMSLRELENHVAWPIVEKHRDVLRAWADHLPDDTVLRDAIDAVPAGWWPVLGRKAFAIRGLLARRDEVRDILLGLDDT